MNDSKKYFIGISPIGWTNDDMPDLGGDIPFETCIKEIALAGYEGTEVGGKFPKDPMTLRKALEPYNLRIAGQWFSSYFTSEQGNYDETIKRFKKQAQFLKDVGAERIIISEQGGSIQGIMDHPIFEDKPVLSEDEWTDLINGLEKLGEIANEMNMKIVYHHHMGTVIQSYEETKKLMENTNPEKVYLLVDTGHMTFAGGDPIRLLTEFAERVAHIHLKDLRKNVLEQVKEKKYSFLQGVKEGVFTVPGDGMINFEKVLETIKSIDYEGWLIVEAEQDPKKAPPLEYAKKGRETIRKYLGI